MTSRYTKRLRPRSRILLASLGYSETDHLADLTVDEIMSANGANLSSAIEILSWKHSFLEEPPLAEWTDIENEFLFALLCQHLSRRALTTLTVIGIKNLSSFVLTSPDQILSARGCGLGTYQELYDALITMRQVVKLEPSFHNVVEFIMRNPPSCKSKVNNLTSR